jgi:mannose-6-phosphate isomerase-like protein (cupin superfamily)
VPGLRHRVPAGLLGGTTSIHEGLLAPGELIPPHTHAREDQCIYVVSGTIHLEIGGEFIEAPAGTYVIKPRGLSHAFWNPGTTPALALEITSPGGFESYYHDMAAVASPEQALAVQAKYGITLPRRSCCATDQPPQPPCRRHPARLAIAERTVPNYRSTIQRGSASDRRG